MTDDASTVHPELLYEVEVRLIERGWCYDLAPEVIVVHGAWEKGRLLSQGVPAHRLWTLAEIENLAGVFWPANPTLGQVLEALAGEGQEPADGL
jgi:hypothetical protein